MRPPHLGALSLSLLLLLTPLHSQIIRMPITKEPNPTSPSKSGFLNLNGQKKSMDILNIRNAQYSGTIHVGSNETPFKVILDTGSSELWIPDSSIADKSWNGYDCSDSSTCKVSRISTVPLKYGKGAILGYEAVDQVKLGSLNIPQYNMLLAYAIDDMTPANFDGILGISLARNLPGYPTLLEMLKTHGLIDVGTFSMYLGDDQNSNGDATGEIIFGGHDPKYALSEFKFVEIYDKTDTLYWAADLKAISYGSEQNITDAGGFPAIFDSGTSLLMLPQDVMNQIIIKGRSQGITFSYDSSVDLYTCNCFAQNILDDLVFYFNGVTLNVPASAYIVRNGGLCYLGIQPHSGYPSLYNPAILGDVLLKNYYTLYTVDNSTIGFAQALPVKHFPVWLILLILLSVSMVIALGVHLYNKRKQKVEPLLGGPGRSIATSTTPKSYFKSFKSKGITIGSDYAEMMSPPMNNSQRLIGEDAQAVREYPAFST